MKGGAMRHRTYAAFSAAAIAVALVLVYSTGAGGQGPRNVTFTTVDQVVSLKPIDNSPGDGDLLQGQFRSGDVILATARSTIRGTKVADVVTHCQLVTDTEAQCQGTWRFNGRRGTRRGSITAAGITVFGAGEISTSPIAGGTGRVRGIRGEIRRTTLALGRDRVVFKILDE
jgi:hypothetical protein